MGQNSMEFGFDLGTTNSSICRIVNGKPVIQKIEVTDDTMPSCVFFNKKKNIVVGTAAYRNMQSERRRATLTWNTASSNSFVEFKRTMGTDTTYHSSNMNADYMSEELSAEVLKRLKSYVGDGTAVNEAVVTVPAKFTVNQKTATMKAAELAGITHCELIQEPIAAAIAYGFNAESKDGYWLVFDFGGGTFDAALIRSDEGVIQVFDTEGDNYLGGKNMDYAIVDTLLVPYLQKEYALDATIADERKHQVLREAMKPFAEEIKNSVSFNNKIDILSNLGELGNDEDGEEMELDLTLSRNDVFACMAPLAQKAIDICLALLERNNLSGKDLHSILLVGGPTYSPLIREMLKERLGAMVDTSVNPMTAVSVGAALYASTIKSETGDVEKQNEEALRLDMEYESTSVEDSEWIAVKCGQLVNEGNIKVRFIKEDGSWESESIEVDSVGNVVEVQLDNGANVFRVKASDMKGNPISVQPNSISIMQGAKVGSAPLPYYIGISAWDSRYEKSVFMPLSGLEKNQLLPAEGYLLTEKTMNDIHPGNEEDKIIIPVYQADEFVEGNSSVLYEYVADVELSGLEIDRYIPANSSVEVKLSVDTSEMMDMEIHFPDLDLTINKHLDTLRHQSVTEASERVQRDLRLAEKSLDYLQSKGVDIRDEIRMLNTVKMENECSLEKKMVLQHLKELYRRIEQMQLKQKLDDEEENLKTWLQQLKRHQLHYGNSGTESHIKDLERAVNKAVFHRDLNKMQELVDEISSIDYHMAKADHMRSCYYKFMREIEDKEKWHDQDAARSHVEILGKLLKEKAPIEEQEEETKILWMLYKSQEDEAESISNENEDSCQLLYH